MQSLMENCHFVTFLYAGVFLVYVSHGILGGLGYAIKSEIFKPSVTNMNYLESSVYILLKTKIQKYNIFVFESLVLTSNLPCSSTVSCSLVGDKYL